MTDTSTRVRPSESTYLAGNFAPVENEVTAFDLSLSYDARRLRIVAVEDDGTLSRKFVLTPNIGSAGRLRLSGFGIEPLRGSGDLVSLVFERVGRSNGPVRLGWQTFVLNDGEIKVKATGARIGIRYDRDR